MSGDNNFVMLSQVNVNGKTEKKGKHTYLSWSFAMTELLKRDPDASWEFHPPQMFGQTMMVSCTVTAFGKPVYMWLPVMDFKNNAMVNPDAMAVNKAMMRCLVKGIAAHGLGLYIYAGEDLPDEGDVNANLQAQQPQQAVQAQPVVKSPLDDSRLDGAIKAIKDDAIKAAKEGIEPSWTVKRLTDTYELRHDQLARVQQEVA